MKKILPATLLLLLLAGCETRFTFNGLICPTDDQRMIKSDLAQCQVYDLKAIDKAMQDPKCKTCLEAKGYKVDESPLDNNASK